MVVDGIDLRLGMVLSHRCRQPDSDGHPPLLAAFRRKDQLASRFSAGSCAVLRGYPICLECDPTRREADQVFLIGRRYNNFA